MNPQHPTCKAGALPIAPRPRFFIFILYHIFYSIVKYKFYGGQFGIRTQSAISIGFTDQPASPTAAPTQEERKTLQD